MGKDTFWNGKLKHVVGALHDQTPKEGKVTEKKRPALEQNRKMTNAYYDVFNNGDLQGGRNGELRSIYKKEGEHYPGKKAIVGRNINVAGKGEGYKNYHIPASPHHINQLEGVAEKTVMRAVEELRHRPKERADLESKVAAREAKDSHLGHTSLGHAIKHIKKDD